MSNHQRALQFQPLLAPSSSATVFIFDILPKVAGIADLGRARALCGCLFVRRHTSLRASSLPSEEGTT